MSSKYDFGGSSSGNNGGNSADRGYAPSYKIAPFIKLFGELSHISVGNSDWGQSISVTYDNGKLYDGILTTRQDKDEYKVFSWNDAPVLEDETLSCDQLPPVLNKSYGGTSYKYEILAARLEGDEEVGYADDAFIKGQEYDGTDPIPLMDVVGDDRFTVWESASEYGPNSCAKTTAKCLTNFGNDAVVDPDHQFKWLADGVSLREELEGMGIIYAKVQRESNNSDHKFYHPIFIDAETHNQILPGESNASSPAPEPSGSSATETATDGGKVDDSPVDEFYATCKELSIDSEPAVLGLLEDMIGDDDNDLTEDMVDRDKVVADLVQ